jgi:DNA modification methylase
VTQAKGKPRKGGSKKNPGTMPTDGATDPGAGDAVPQEAGLEQAFARAMAPVSVSDLVPAPYNPRTISKEARAGLRASLEAFGDISGIVWNARSGHLVAGHQRVNELRSMHGGAMRIDNGALVVPGGERFAIRTVDWDEMTEKAANLAANNPHTAGDFDASVAALLAEVEASDADLFRSLRLDEICTLADDPASGETDPDDVPDPGPDPITQPGDVWTLGEHRLLCGDSTRVEDVVRLMRGESATWMWTDPPYGVSYVGGTADALTIENDDAGGLPRLLAGAFAAVDTVLEDGAPIYIAHPAGPISRVFLEAFFGVGWRLHETLIWVKDRFVLGHSDYHYRHEPLLYGHKGGGRRWYGGRDKDSVFEIARSSRNAEHPTMKPVELVVRQLQNSSQRGDIGIEPFGGSGTTLIAAEQLGRRCRVIELDPRYCDVIVQRWEKFTGGKATREAV